MLVSMTKQAVLKIGLITLLLLLLSLRLVGQTGNELNRSIVLIPESDTLFTDSLTIIAETLQLTYIPSGESLSHCVKVNNKHIIWNNQDCLAEYHGRELALTYRVLHFDLYTPYRILDTAVMQPLISEEEVYIGFDFSPFEGELENRDIRNLNYSGTFSRGLSFGNAQSLVLNSAFNLQMNGTLGDDIDITAVISDENIPIQPDGSTRQIQEFDRIFIELSKDKHLLTAGDIELRNAPGHFMHYHRKTKGLNYKYAGFAGDGFLETEVGASISQGKFSRQQLATTEGNQGPYRLSSSEGERFIIILAGTESVFLDGRRLTRGLEDDYIIDYNSAEITFTHNTMITKDSRIIIEFEFIDQSYSRTTVAANSSYTLENTEFYFQFFNEQDSRSPGGLLDLSREDIAVLEAAGDQTDQLFTETIKSLDDDTDNGAIRYRQIDFPWQIEGRDTVFRILEVSSNSDLNLVTARFTDLGQGNGNYIRKTDGRNGRVYEFVPPDSINGKMNGRFEPVRRLTPPQKQQMTSIGINHKFTENTSAGVELNISNFDNNRFSILDNEDNAGLAGRVFLNTSKDFGQDSLPWQVFHNLNYEFINRTHNILNPYREAEFERDWNYFREDRHDEHLLHATLGVSKGDQFSSSYQFSGLFRGPEYSGTRNLAELYWQFEKMEFALRGNWLKTENIFNKTTFFRPEISLSRELEFMTGGKIGYVFQEEENRFFEADSDSLLNASFRFVSHKMFLEQNTGTGLGWRASYTLRSDELPNEGELEKTSEAQNLRLSGTYQITESHFMQLTAETRNLDVTTFGAEQLQARRTYIGRAEYRGDFLNGAINFGNVYETSSGQEPKVEFEYREVPPGEGQYTWIDLNGDGIQQINEFFLTPNPEERNFIRLPIVTDEFVSVNSVSINQNLNFDPRRLDLRNTAATAFLKKIATNSTLRIQRRTQIEERSAELNPWKFKTRDSSLVAFNLASRHTLFFNRGNPTYDIQFSIQNNTVTNEQITGNETRANREQTIRGRWNIERQLATIFQIKFSQNEGISEAFQNNNFSLNGSEYRAEISYIFSQSFSGKFWYSFENKSNSEEFGNETGRFHELSTEWSFREQQTSSIFQLRLSFNSVSTEGALNTPAAILMLNGLSPGNNLRITANLERRLTDNLRLSLQYTGRKPGTSQFVHTGGVTATAAF